jgi:tRNA threonylcarbamoyladenosine biosynthesis protein TsaB
VRLVALDTATENCSAALWIDGRIMDREAEFERGHADRILAMIDELLAEAGTSLRGLDALAFGRGPGSFTGVRLAASVAQGLAFGAGLGVVAVSDLRALAQRVLELDSATQRTLVCNDARMQEVYWACFERTSGGVAEAVGEERVGKPGSLELPAGWTAGVAGAGRGFAAYPELRSIPGVVLTAGNERLLPRAREIALLAAPQVLAGRLLPPDEALPVYLRDDVVRAP